jgi:hypothetical protein
LVAQGGDSLKFSPEALRILASHAWPGNVRELQNVVNKIMMSASGPEIGAAEVRQELASAQTDDNDVRLETLESQAVAQALQNTGGHRGRAATQLGISRRTLSRKLRRYGLASARNVARTALGTLSPAEQQQFRAEIKIPVQLVLADGQEFPCAAANLGMGGIGLEGLDAALDRECGLRVRFRFPDSNAAMDIAARVAWSDMHGRAGITFKDIPPAARQEIRRWLDQKVAEEGWTVLPEPSESLAE